MSLLVSVCVCVCVCMRICMLTCYPIGWLELHTLTDVGWKEVIVQITSEPCVIK